MKTKILLFFVLAILCSLTGCRVHICDSDCTKCNELSNIESSSEKDLANELGSSLDNPIPFGECAQIGDDDQDVQMKINRIYYDTKDYSSEKVLVVEFQITAIDLNGNSFYSNSASLVLKNGTEATEYGSTEFNGTKSLSTITFATKGSVVAHSLYEPIELSECLCLYYYNSRTGNYIYFALS